MDKKFWLHPATITILSLLVIGTLLIIGYNYWEWFGGVGGKLGADGLPTNAKAGDEFTKDGVRYKYVCIDVQCITAPCPPACSWQAINDAPSNDRAIPASTDRVAKENLINGIINKTIGSQGLISRDRTRLRNALANLSVRELSSASTNQPLGMTPKEFCEWVKKNVAPSLDCSWVKS